VLLVRDNRKNFLPRCNLVAQLVLKQENDHGHFPARRLLEWELFGVCFVSLHLHVYMYMLASGHGCRCASMWSHGVAAAIHDSMPHRLDPAEGCHPDRVGSTSSVGINGGAPVEDAGFSAQQASTPETSVTGFRGDAHEDVFGCLARGARGSHQPPVVKHFPSGGFAQWTSPGPVDMQVVPRSPCALQNIRGKGSVRCGGCASSIVWHRTSRCRAKHKQPLQLRPTPQPEVEEEILEGFEKGKAGRVPENRCGGSFTTEHRA
jgi:hypothetical protein